MTTVKPKYKLLRTSHAWFEEVIDEMNLKIAGYIRAGWVPSGPPVFHCYRRKHYCIQPMCWNLQQNPI